MEQEQKEITRAETVSSAALWFGILTGPIVWAVQLLLVFGLPESVVCAPGTREQGKFFSLGVEPVIQIINAVATAITLSALLVAYLQYRRYALRDHTEADRARWMATAGLFTSTLFLIITAMKFASPLFLSPCGTSP